MLDSQSLLHIAIIYLFAILVGLPIVLFCVASASLLWVKLKLSSEGAGVLWHWEGYQVNKPLSFHVSKKAFLKECVACAIAFAVVSYQARAIWSIVLPLLLGLLPFTILIFNAVLLLFSFATNRLISRLTLGKKGLFVTGAHSYSPINGMNFPLLATFLSWNEIQSVSEAGANVTITMCNDTFARYYIPLLNEEARAELLIVFAQRGKTAGGKVALSS